MTFPKIIHQIWLQGENNIPEKFLPEISRIKNFHPSWQHIMWDDITIINLLRKNKIWIDTYYEFKYLHQKVDYAKYVILYEYGGVYLDVDISILKPFDHLLDEYSDYDMLVSKLKINKFESIICCRKPICINNGTIISKPKNLTMEKLINYINDHPHHKSITKFACISNTTGPIVFTSIILKDINNKTIKILEPEYLEPKILGIGEITLNTYVVHEHEGSWFSSSFRNMAQFYFRHKISVYITFIIVVIFLISFYFWHKK